MKVCIISESYYKEISGGAEIQCSHIASELLKRGNDVFYIHKSSLKKGHYIDEGIHIYPVYFPEILSKALKRIIPLRLILEYILLNRAMNEIKADFWYYRSVNTFLDSIVKIKQKTGGSLIYALSMDMQTNSKEWIKKYGSYYHERFRHCLVYVDYFIFQKEQQRQAFKNQYGYDGSVIFNGHPLSDHSDREPSKSVIWVGNFRELKKPDQFIQLVKEYSGSNDIKFHMVGRPASRYNEDLESVRTNKRFIYHGYLENREVLNIIRNSYILISTSVSEGFPNVFIESWKYGVPVISFINPDNLITDNKVGFVCSNIQEMISCIDLLFTNEELYAQISRNCIELVKHRFSIISSVNRLLSVIGCEDKDDQI